MDAADDRRNSRRARNCSGEAGVVASVLFLVTMAGSFWLCRQVVYSYETRRASRSTLDEGVVRPGIKRRPRSMWATILITAEDAILFPLVRVMWEYER